MSKTSTIAEHRTSILIAIIAFIGAITPILVTSISSWASNMPIVDIDINVYGNDVTKGATITLTNFGFGPATNVTLIVDTPVNISGTINKDSTIEVHSTEINGTRLEAHIPRLVQGSGSFVELDLSLARNQSISHLVKYRAYAIYDQGSTMREFTWNSGPLGDVNNHFENFLQPYWSIVFVPIMLFIFGYPVFLYFYRGRNRQQRSFIVCVIDNIINIRQELKGNSKSTKSLTTEWAKHESDFGFIKKKEMQDFIILDDFYAELEERNRNSSSNISEYRLEMLNKNLLYLANNALEKIDWKKYAR